MTSDSDEPKIIIDEDWKAQVQAERDAAKAGHDAPAATSESAAVGPASGAAAAQSPAPDDLPDFDMPPASLTFLCTTLATQAMIALGQVPNPLTGNSEARPKQAKHYIDTLGMLEEKTAGNRTPDESQLFSDILHQLRMAFVAVNR
jgi:Domain of unknown function (DUF1844)